MSIVASFPVKYDTLFFGDWSININNTIILMHVYMKLVTKLCVLKIAAKWLLEFLQINIKM